ncbi:hypothetical protein M378DRAFT_162478 [Amanita muscaria Koide BX008]|uniref:Uncharacterized protein n=1 Tax=Amanita muscaria (strain Koide BX008) TaxID=946122 RepID=A0A0C2SPP1_AMAMK|nr:hypothetical protein M378DRAFT_162478 [Amanita muscaria Koide BX008]
MEHHIQTLKYKDPTYSFAKTNGRKRTQSSCACQPLTISRGSEFDWGIRLFGAFCAKKRKCHKSALVRIPGLSAFTVMTLVLPPFM